MTESTIYSIQTSREIHALQETSLLVRLGRMVTTIVSNMVSSVCEAHEQARNEDLKYIIPGTPDKPPVLSREILGGFEEYALVAKR